MKYISHCQELKEVNRSSYNAICVRECFNVCKYIYFLFFSIYFALSSLPFCSLSLCFKSIILALSFSSLYFLETYFYLFFHVRVFITQQVLKMSHVFCRYKRQYVETDTFVFNGYGKRTRNITLRVNKYFPNKSTRRTPFSHSLFISSPFFYVTNMAHDETDLFVADTFNTQDIGEIYCSVRK